jgi:hypothetical protein
MALTLIILPQKQCSDKGNMLLWISHPSLGFLHTKQVPNWKYIIITEHGERTEGTGKVPVSFIRTVLFSLYLLYG